jgi:hypothetical protein
MYHDQCWFHRHCLTPRPQPSILRCCLACYFAYCFACTLPCLLPASCPREQSMLHCCLRYCLPCCKTRIGKEGATRQDKPIQYKAGLRARLLLRCRAFGPSSGYALAPSGAFGLSRFRAGGRLRFRAFGLSRLGAVRALWLSGGWQFGRLGNRVGQLRDRKWDPWSGQVVTKH